MWRRLLIIHAALFGALSGAAIALKSERISNNLKIRIQRLAQKHLGLEVNVGRLELQFLPPGLGFGEVTIRGKETGSLAVNIQKGNIRVHPWPSPSGAVVINRLMLEGVDASFSDKDLPQASKEKESPFPLDIRELTLKNARIRFASANDSVDLNGIDLTVYPSAAYYRDISLGLKEVNVRHGAYDIKGLSTQLQASFLGSFDHPVALDVHQWLLQRGESQLRLSGRVPLEIQENSDMQLRGAFNLRSLSSLLPSLPELSGQSEFSLFVQGSLNKPRINAHVRIADTAVRGAPLGTIEANVKFANNIAQIDSLRISGKNTGSLSAHGRISVDKEGEFSLSAQTQHLFIPAIIEAAGISNPWLRLSLSSTVEIRGRLFNRNASIKIDGEVENFAILGAGYHSNDPEHFFDLDEINIHANVSLNAHAAHLDAVHLKFGESELAAHGSLSFDPVVGLNLRADSTSINLENLGPVAGVRLRGHSPLSAQVEGPYANPVISANAEVDSFAVNEYSIGALKTELKYSRLRLSGERLFIKKGGGTVTGAVLLDFSGKKLSLQSRLHLHEAALNELLAMAGTKPEFNDRFSAPVSGDVQLNGPLLQQSGDFRLTSDHLSIDGAGLGAVSVRGRLHDGVNLLWAEFALQPEEGEASGYFAITQEGTYDTVLNTRQLEVLPLMPLLGGARISGHVDSETKLRGPLHELSGSIQAYSQDAVLYGTHLGKTSFAGPVQKSLWHLQGTLWDGRAKGEGEITVNTQMQFELKAAHNNVDVAALYPSLQDIASQLSGTLSAHGRLSDAKAITAQGVLSSASGGYRSITLSAQKIIPWSYEHGVLEVKDSYLANNDMQLVGSGSLGADGTLALRVFSSGDVEAIRSLAPRLQLQKGRFDVKLDIGGTVDEPLIGGEASLASTTLHLNQPRQNVEQLQLHVFFTGRSVDIDSGSAVTGGGRVQFSGQILFPAHAATELNLVAEATSVAMRPLADMQLTASGNLSLSGPVTDLLLRGDVKIEALRYTANLDLERLIPKRHAPPLRVPAIDPNSSVRLAVRVSAPNNILLSSKVVEAEWQADLVVTGTTTRMGLVGSMSPLWGRARYQNNTFTVESASVLFTDEYRIFTEFNVRAKSRACNMDVIVDIHGNSEGYNIVPRGEDETGIVSPQDVLACLQFGVRLRNFNTQDSANLRNTSLASSLDALWTVSGLDQQVKRFVPLVDELRLTSGWSLRSRRTTPRVVIGKELGHNTQLSYSRSLDEFDDQVLSIQYRMSKIATMMGTWNSVSDAQIGDLGLDLRLRWEFR